MWTGLSERSDKFSKLKKPLVVLGFPHRAAMVVGLFRQKESIDEKKICKCEDDRDC
jgi:hypothetical protein